MYFLSSIIVGNWVLLVVFMKLLFSLPEAFSGYEIPCCQVVWVSGRAAGLGSCSVTL